MGIYDKDEPTEFDVILEWLVPIFMAALFTGLGIPKLTEHFWLTVSALVLFGIVVLSVFVHAAGEEKHGLVKKLRRSLTKGLFAGGLLLLVLFCVAPEWTNTVRANLANLISETPTKMREVIPSSVFPEGPATPKPQF